MSVIVKCSINKALNL